MGNIIKYGGTSNGSIKSGEFNIAVNGNGLNTDSFHDGISPIIGGYTVYINKASGGPAIYPVRNDAELISLVNRLGTSVATAAAALTWINSQSTMTVTNSNYPSIVTSGIVLNLDAGFVSSYSKGGTGWRDLSGNGNNGTLINGPTFSSDGGGSIVFDGVDDYLQQPLYNSTFNIRNGITLSVIVKRTSGFNQLQDSFFISRPPAWYFYDAYNSGSIRGEVFIDGVRRGAVTTTLPFDGQWYSIIYTYDSTTRFSRIYKNGVLSSSTQLTGLSNYLIDSSSNNFETSFRNTLGRTFNVSTLQVYNRALSDAEVLQNYYAGLERFIPTNGLVLSLDAQNTNLYATSATTAYDVSGNDYNGTLTNGTQYVGNGNGSWSFDGADDYINNIGTASSFSFIQNTGIFTICAWVRLTDLSVARYFLGNNDGTTNSKGFYLGYSGVNGRLWIAITYGVNGQLAINLTKNNFFLDNNWVFVTVVGNGTTCQFYRNGQIFDSAGNIVALSTGDSTRNLSIGRINNFNTAYWSGNVSQTSIYNRALTATEISTMYNATRSRYGL
jgi:hypothetical protein